MQPTGEENTPPKEKIRQPSGYKFCVRCDRDIPIYYINTGFCPICGTRLLDNTRKERIEKNE